MEPDVTRSNLSDLVLAFVVFAAAQDASDTEHLRQLVRDVPRLVMRWRRTTGSSNGSYARRTPQLVHKRAVISTIKKDFLSVLGIYRLL